MARLGRRAAVVDPRRAGRDAGRRFTAPLRFRSVEARGCARYEMGVAVAGRPLVPGAGYYPERQVVPGGRRADVAGRSVRRDERVPVVVEREPEGVAKAADPDGGVRSERVIARNRPVGLVAQDLAADVVRVLGHRGLAPHGRLGHRVLVAEGDVELAVLPEGEPATLVTAVVAGGQGDEGGLVTGCAGALGESHDRLRRFVAP